MPFWSKLLPAVAAAVLLTPVPGGALAHGDHDEQSPALIDPLVTHHAVLEDELKLNLFGSRFSAEDASAGALSLELAYAFTDLLGVEVFLSLGMTDAGGRLRGGLGDLELQFPKISFVREYGFVMTAYLGVVAPTAAEGSGLGEGAWILAPHVLTDLALGPVGLQMNGALELTTGGEVVAELRVSTAFTVALDAAGHVLLSPLVELEAEVPVSEAAPVGLAVVPGVKLGLGGWHVGLGVALPFGPERELDFEAMLQVGYHVSWRRLFDEAAVAQ